VRDGGERIESPRAYLSTVVSRLSFDHLRSARVRREIYVGEWLPEPLVASADDDPARKAEIADSLSLAFLVLLESLSPEQRATYLLREVFDEPYDRIAEIVGTSAQNARRLATRARRHVRSGAPRFEASREAARGARDSLLRGRRGGRSSRPGGTAGPRRGAPRRRRRQDTRHQTCGPRADQGGAHADGGVCAASDAARRLHLAPRGGHGQPGAIFFDRESAW
jgi:RNA polymerase sigma factor (sigma-70 family)